MIKNFVKIYFRNVSRNKLFTLINVAGLSIGITACLIVYNYVAFHKSFDKMYKAPENVYRIVTEAYVEGKLAETYGVTMQFLGPELKEFPEVEDFTRMLPLETMLIYEGDDIFDRLNIWAVDSSFIDFFGIKVLRSNGPNALKKPYSIVVSESTAKKMFGTIEVIGQTIEIGYGPRVPFPLEITGVIEDSPINSHIKYDLLISGVDPNSIAGQLTVFNGGDHTYYYPFFSTYVRMKENTRPSDLEAKFPAFLNHRIKTVMDKYGMRRIFLQPLDEVHLGPKYKWGAEMIINRGTRENESSASSIKWISFSALTLLLFSIFNFVNLNLINYSKRSTELSVRKFLGAMPVDFLKQILIEVLILIFFATLISVVLLVAFKGVYYEYLRLPAQYSIFNNIDTYKYISFILFSVLFLKVAFLFIMIRLLKLFNSLKKFKEVPFSKYLVVLQFMGAFILVNLAILFHKQLEFMLSKDLGHTKDNIFFIEKFTTGSGPASLTLDHLEAFKAELAKHSSIQNVCLSSITPGYYHQSNQRTWLSDHDKVFSNTVWIDKDYVKGYDLKLIAGRNISSINSNEVLINEALMKALGITEAGNIIGKSLYIDESMAHHMASDAKEIVGVLKDYNQEPLSKAVAPTKYHYAYSNRGYYSIKYSGGNHKDLLAYSKKAFEKFYPDDEFNYSFLDEFINKQYNSDIQFKELINIATFLSVIIASLGIFGLITYSLEVHRKANAIRMILGSSVFGLFSFFLRSYLIQFLTVVVLAMPFTVLLARNIMSNYEYHIDINYFLFLIPALPIFGVILFIISVQVFRAANENPIKALRAE